MKFTTELERNPVPFTVSVNPAPPARPLVGESVVTVGNGLLIVNVAAADVPPPGAGFVTVIETVPAVAISAAVIAAVTCPPLTKVVVRGEPLKFTTDVEIRFVPFTIRENAAPPAVAEFGTNEVIVGTGFAAAPILKLTEFDVPPPGVGFVTVTAGVPTVVTSPAKIAAVTCVALTNVVVLGLPPKFTAEVFKKFVPFTVRVNAPEPAVTPVGKSVVTVGTGLFTANSTEFDVPPPGVGLVTLTENDPAVRRSVERIVADT